MALLAAALALLQVFLAKPLPVFLGEVVVDDAFYYLVPAQNFLLGLGTSFDGLNLTNGYHPLWMLLAIAGSALAPDELELYLLSAMGGVFYILGALVLSFCLFPRMRLLGKAALFAVFCFNFYVFKVSLLGMENGLNFFILAVLLAFLQNGFDAASAKKCWILGGLLTLLALSRVDQILFAFFVYGVLLFQCRQALGGFVRGGLRVGLPILLVFGGYLCMNKLVFDTFLPISGLVKNHYESLWLADAWPRGGFWPNLAYHVNFALGAALAFNAHVIDSVLSQNLGIALPGSLGEETLNMQKLAHRAPGPAFLALYGALAVPAALGLPFSLYKVAKRELSPFYLAFAAFALFHFLLYALRLPHFTTYGRWYFTFEFLVILLCFFFGMEACCRLALGAAKGRLRRALGGLLPAAALAFCLGTFLLSYAAARNFHQVDERVQAFHRAALWANEHLPEGAVIGAHSAGTLGLFVKDRHVVNLDGLINSAAYFALMQKGQFADYLLKHVDYYADYSHRDLAALGFCWLRGCVPPENLRLLAKWRLNATQSYYILQILPKQ